jgi:hypothetical protein
MIKVRLHLAIAFVSLFTSLAFCQNEPLPSDGDLAATTARGRMLYDYDQAAWHSSDAVMAANPAQGTIGRYIAQKTEAGWVVAYGRLNESRDAFLIAVLATQGKAPEEFSVKKFDPAQRDSGFYLAAAKGIETALHDFQGPNRPYNAAVLPASNNQLYVYLVPAQTEQGVYPLGTDVRYMISPDGGTIVEKRQLHKGLIINRGPVPPGTTVVGGSHSHVLSNVPEDTDVFYVLSRKPSMSEYIGTQIAVYAVNTDGTIKIVERMKKHR